MSLLCGGRSITLRQHSRCRSRVVHRWSGRWRRNLPIATAAVGGDEHSRVSLDSTLSTWTDGTVRRVRATGIGQLDRVRTIAEQSNDAGGSFSYSNKLQKSVVFTASWLPDESLAVPVTVTVNPPPEMLPAWSTSSL